MGETVQWLHQLPKTKPVDREAYLIEAARGRRVIHVGFTDHPMREERLRDGTWLHAELAEVARELVGVDVDEEGVEWARAHGFEAYAADASAPGELAALRLEPADLVIAGEVIEHIDAPGPFLRGLRQLGSDLIVTTPNALQPLICLVPLTGNEMMHPDHVVPAYTPRTLIALMERNGWDAEILYYHGGANGDSGAGVKGAAAGAVKWVVGHLPRPYWSDGLIASAKSSSSVEP
jgi:hypothetical protein